MKIAKDKLQSLCLKLLNSKEEISTLICEERAATNILPKIIKNEK
jgi:hypothetical protein